MARWVRQLGLLSILLGSAGTALAQESATPAPGGATRPDAVAPAIGPTPPPAGTPSALPFDLWYLWGDDGRPVVIPDRVHLRDYLAWLARQQNADAGPVAWSVTRIACMGTAEDDRAQLKVTLQVQTTTADTWVLVPLQMAEATLRAPPEYQGAGEALPGEYHSETGYSWWFRGKGSREQGRHELTLSLGVPIRRQPGGRRIQLSLPPTAVSSLKLRIPQVRVTARGPEKSIVSVARDEAGSLIDVTGLGARLDLSWQVSPEPVAGATSLEVGTSITATLTPAERTATLEATQNYRSLNQLGMFDEVRVTLPPGSELVRVDGPEYREHRAIPENPNQVLVRFKGPTAGPVDLRWTVRMPLPGPGSDPVVIEGFDVDRASFQTGVLAVVVAGDFRLSQVPDEDKWVQRINLTDLPTVLRQARTTAAYRFVNRLRLRLNLQPVAPYVTVSPRVWMHVDPLGAEFTATYSLQVLRGSIPELTLHWPGWKESGWNVESLSGTGGLEPRLLDDAAAADELRIEFAEPARGVVELVLRARRAIAEGGTSVDLTLPAPRTAAHSSTLLAIGRPANLEVAVVPGEGTVMHPYADAVGAIGIPRERSKLHFEGYRIESADARLNATLTRHRRVVNATTSVEAVQRPGIVAVRQRIDYDVSYDNLSQIRLRLPRGLKPSQVHVQSPDGTNLPIRNGTESFDRIVSVSLDPPRTGSFALELRYAFELGEVQQAGNDQVLTLPVVTAADAEVQSTEFRWRDASGRESRVADEGWQRTPASDGEWAWTAPQAAAEINVMLIRRSGAWSGITVSRALLRSTVNADGSIRTQAAYSLTGFLPEIMLGFPADTQPLEFRWNGRKLRPGSPQTDAAGGAVYQVSLERNGNGNSDHLLEVETISHGPFPSRFTSQSALTAPRLPTDLAVLDCLWQVALPGGQHLFLEPEGFAPEFEWRRAGLFFQREPRISSPELLRWIGLSLSSTADDSSRDETTYLFRCSGNLTTLTLRTMGESGIVLIGAGTALLMGWLLLKWPSSSQVLSVLVASFVVACIAVWQAGPILVLLQPALFGLLLAIGGVWLDSYLKRRGRPVAVTLSSPSGFLTPASSVPRSPAVVAGSNDRTSVRDQALPAPDVEPAGHLSESGIRA